MDFSSLTARVSRYVEVSGVPALALGIVRENSLVYAQGFGGTASGDRISVDTPFPSCSTGKVITAAAVMRLVESQMLDLDQPVVERLPALTYPPGGDASRVTLRHLLSHTSGLSSDPAISRRFEQGEADALERHVMEELPAFRALPPGEVLVYSNPGFNLAGHLAALAAEQPFPSLVRDLVCEPLGMSTTSFAPDGEALAKVAAVLPEDQRGRRLPIPYPAGGAITTVRDLAQLAMSHLRRGAPLLSPATTELMQSVHADGYTRPPRFYGLGFDIEHHRGRKLVTHGGGGHGCGSMFALVPGDGIAAIALFNHPAGYGVRARDILDSIWGESGRERGDAVASVQISTGDYRLAWHDLPGFPARVSVTADGPSPQLIVDGRTSPLEHLEDTVWTTTDGKASIGFVPGERFAMLDFYGIGLVSALPYCREA